MINVRWIAIAVALFFAMSGPGLAANSPSVIGSVENVVRTASSTPLGGTAKRVSANDGISQYDTIETVAKGGIKINFVDETELQLGGDSRLLIDEMVFDPASKQGKSVINLLAGTYVYISGNIPRDNVEIRTPSSTIGIRGTEFTVHVTQSGATSVSVIDGLVEMRSLATGAQVSIPAGSNASVSETGVVAQPTPGLVKTGDTVVDAAAETLVAQVAAKAVQDTATTTSTTTEEQPAEQPDTQVQTSVETDTASGDGERRGNNSIPVQANVSNAKGAASKFSGKEVNYQVNSRKLDTYVREQKTNSGNGGAARGKKSDTGSGAEAADTPASGIENMINSNADTARSSSNRPAAVTSAIKNSKAQAVTKAASKGKGNAFGANNGKGPGNNNGKGPGNNNGQGPGNNNGQGPGNNNGQGSGSN